MTRKLPLPDVNDLYALYQAGESTVDLAKGLGCHSSTLRNLFKRHGLPVRTFSEMQLALSARRTPERRAEIVAAAHDAVRGKRQSFDKRCRMAMGRERAPRPLTKAEARVHALLKGAGLPVVRERACGPYNIDFAVGHSIAVECFGGGWHLTGRAAARHQERFRYLIDAGWHVAIVWVDAGRGSLWINGLKDVIAGLKLTSRNPTARREYWVVRSNGELILGRPDLNDFPLKPAGELSRDAATGRYYRAG